jgi:hypothetical protein
MVCRSVVLRKPCKDIFHLIRPHSPLQAEGNAFAIAGSILMNRFNPYE